MTALIEAVRAAMRRDDELLALAVERANKLLGTVGRDGWSVSAKRLSRRRVMVCVHAGPAGCRSHEIRGRRALRDARSYVLGIRSMAVMTGRQYEG